jgi:hypothetical protein
MSIHTRQQTIHEMPVDLWKRLKIRAVADGDTLQTALIKAIEQYVDPKIDAKVA